MLENKYAFNLSPANGYGVNLSRTWPFLKHFCINLLNADIKQYIYHLMPLFGFDVEKVKYLF